MTMAYVGDWRRLPNLSADSVGSIHDDDAARRVGFDSALVGGSVLLAAMTPVLVRLFGRDWYERGFLRQSFVKPIYVASEVRLVARERTPADGDARLLEFGFEDRDGHACTAGYVGLGDSGAPSRAPWERPGEPPLATVPAEDPDPGVAIGVPRTVDVLCTPSLHASRIRRDAIGADDTWYSVASPWGGPIAPTFLYILAGSMQRGSAAEAGAGGEGTGQRTARTRAGMNGTFQLVQAAPMACGVVHRMTTTVVEKGTSGRTAFRTSENEIRAPDGRIVMRARQKVRWFR
jgi:acyl dehydratase